MYPDKTRLERKLKSKKKSLKGFRKRRDLVIQKEKKTLLTRLLGNHIQNKKREDQHFKRNYTKQVNFMSS